MNKQYLEDFSIGQKFGSDCCATTADEIIEFATQFDPQPFHVDDQAAKETFFGGLAASGWHTASLTSRLLINSQFQPAGGIVGLGIDELRWHNPVRPGDELRVETEILELRPSKSKPSHGVVKASITTFNQNEDVVQSYILHLLALSRAETL